MGRGVWGTKSFEVVLTRELKVVAILMGGGGGGRKKCPCLKQEGVREVLPCLEGQSFGPTISYFVAPLPVINDQSPVQKVSFSRICPLKAVLEVRDRPTCQTCSELAVAGRLLHQPWNHA